ncbi:DUF397 domain-containing protein [Actinomadura madurae]|uniref:DUF397 domain-containing protein n=1 Tax=Actinomadura madurae TaxID=1993 RepID=UPI0020D1F7ED|nr:DUF397 domain-containing protein [Actinomadura madurae]MCP9951873.1 DUF397 domain-containing protein [Actinomadura madurae]MCP9968641.1 DUF397 domain-containing protein [Actinomadura madurae]MCP9981117.1 DUF397 domain-containing protein [Actinomadura madurae]MCQ0007383.1 DUF397 domain-containing protein [Actinomadura madurae]MCQ0017311.1 DUF397 domain-containing protein [Actinomadura madurae]
MDLSQAVWRKASRSTAEGDNCVEVAAISRAVALRDSKDPNGPKLIIGHSGFRSFVHSLKNL